MRILCVPMEWASICRNESRLMLRVERSRWKEPLSCGRRAAVCVSLLSLYLELMVVNRTRLIGVKQVECLLDLLLLLLGQIRALALWKNTNRRAANDWRSEAIGCASRLSAAVCTRAPFPSPVSTHPSSFSA